MTIAKIVSLVISSIMVLQYSGYTYHITACAPPYARRGEAGRAPPEGCGIASERESEPNYWINIYMRLVRRLLLYFIRAQRAGLIIMYNS